MESLARSGARHKQAAWRRFGPPLCRLAESRLTPPAQLGLPKKANRWPLTQRSPPRPFPQIGRHSRRSLARAGLSQGMGEVMLFGMGQCPRNRFRTSPWQTGSCGVADGLGPHYATALQEIPIGIPNQTIQILAPQHPFMKRFGVQALAPICRGGAFNGTAQTKALTPNRLDALANLP